MYFNKCCISNDKLFERKKIIPGHNFDLNTLPINKKVLLYITNKEIYIYPNPNSIYFCNKFNIYIGIFNIINNTTKYLSNINKTVHLPLNTRFFLLYFYISQISKNSNIHIISQILDSISIIDSINCKDNQGDDIMYPNDLI